MMGRTTNVKNEGEDMPNELMDPSDTFNMPPELIEVTTRYLETNSIDETAESLGIPKEKVSFYLNKKESKRFIDSVFLDQGYINRHKLQSAMQKLIDQKIEELDEAELGSNKDIADLLMMALKMRETFVKESIPPDPPPKIEKQTNVQVNAMGENYENLLRRLIED